MKSQFSPPGAMSPLDPRFYTALDTATAAIMAAVKAFEAETGRVCDGVSLGRFDVTRIDDQEPQYLREAFVSWLPMEGEFDR